MMPALHKDPTTAPDTESFIAATAEAEAGFEDLLASDSAAVASLRRLILEGLEGIDGTEEEADDAWLDSLDERIRQKAAPRDQALPRGASTSAHGWGAISTGLRISMNRSLQSYR